MARWTTSKKTAKLSTAVADIVAEDPPTGPCFIDGLPVETLSHIFKHVDMHRSAQYAYPRAVRKVACSRERTSHGRYDTHQTKSNFERIVGCHLTSPQPYRDFHGCELYEVSQARNVDWPYEVTAIERPELRHVMFDNLTEAVELLLSCPKLRVLPIRTCGVHAYHLDGTDIIPGELPSLVVAALPKKRLVKAFLPQYQYPALQYFTFDKDFSCEKLEEDLCNGHTAYEYPGWTLGSPKNRYNILYHKRYDWRETLQEIFVFLKLPIASIILDEAQ